MPLLIAGSLVACRDAATLVDPGGFEAPQPRPRPEPEPEPTDSTPTVTESGCWPYYCYDPVDLVYLTLRADVGGDRVLRPVADGAGAQVPPTLTLNVFTEDATRAISREGQEAESCRLSGAVREVDPLPPGVPIPATDPARIVTSWDLVLHVEQVTCGPGVAYLEPPLDQLVSWFDGARIGVTLGPVTPELLDLFDPDDPSLVFASGYAIRRTGGTWLADDLGFAAVSSGSTRLPAAPFLAAAPDAPPVTLDAYSASLRLADLDLGNLALGPNPAPTTAP